MSEESVIDGSGGEGSWLDVFSFMNSDDRKYSHLKTILELSNIQSHLLDNFILEAMMTEHIAGAMSKRRIRRPMKAVVEGGGPIGLFSALQLFLAGFHVTSAFCV